MVVQKFPVPAFKLIDAILATISYSENGYDLLLLHDPFTTPNEIWIEARSTHKGRTEEMIVAQCWRAAVIILEEDRAGETTAILSAGGEEDAAHWEILGGSDEDHDDLTYLLHQISAAHTAALVITNWWTGAIRQWWERLSVPDKGPAQAERDEGTQPTSKPWEKVPDVGWNQKAVKLLWYGYSGPEIARQVSVAHKTLLNRLTDLRSVHGSEIVPYLRHKKSG
jgi:hypothetical protein